MFTFSLFSTLEILSDLVLCIFRFFVLQLQFEVNHIFYFFFAVGVELAVFFYEDFFFGRIGLRKCNFIRHIRGIIIAEKVIN